MPLTNQARLFEKWKTLSNEKIAIQCIVWWGFKLYLKTFDTKT